MSDSSYNMLKKRKSQDGGPLLALQHSLQAFLGWAVWHRASHMCPETPSYISVTDTNIRFFNPQYWFKSVSHSEGKPSEVQISVMKFPKPLWSFSGRCSSQTTGVPWLRRASNPSPCSYLPEEIIS